MKTRGRRFNLRLGWLTLSYGCIYGVSAQESRENLPITHAIEVEQGVTLNVVEWGGKGSPILFVPSWSATSHVFDTFAPKLTDAHRVLVINMRGHGPSSRPTDGYTIERLIEDIEGVLDQLGIQRATLVGLSRSESLVSHFAAKYPDRVASLIYLTGPLDRPYYAARFQEPAMANSAAERSAVEAELQKVCGAKPREVPSPPGSFDAEANKVGTEWRAADTSPPYSTITAPAIAFWFLETDKEYFYSRACDSVADQGRVRELLRRLNRASIPIYAMQAHDIGLFEQNMKNGKVILLPGAQYYTYLSHPDVVEEQIRLFLDGERTPPAPR
jgi:pimeloyl-ACP methyl ester carboxylesterase